MSYQPSSSSYLAPHPDPQRLQRVAKNITENKDENYYSGCAIIIIAGVSVFGTQSDGDNQTQGDKAENPNARLGVEQVATNSTELSETSTSGQSREPRFIQVMVLTGIVFSVYALFCLAFLLPTFEKGFYEELELSSITAGSEVLLSYISFFFFFIWKATESLKWQKATPFESTVSRSPIGNAILWIAGVVIQLNEPLIRNIVMYPLIEQNRDIESRVFSQLHLAFEHSLLGKITFGALLGQVLFGYCVVLWLFYLFKISCLTRALFLFWPQVRSNWLGWQNSRSGDKVFWAVVGTLAIGCVIVQASFDSIRLLSLMMNMVSKGREETEW